jgi:membrane AbrB-like protein
VRAPAPDSELVYRLGGGTAGALALTTLGVPAGAIVGAVLGSAVMAAARNSPEQQLSLTGIRIAGLVLLGAAAGLRLDGSTLAQLAAVALPLAVALGGLLVAQLLLSWALTKAFKLDPVTALLATAPGGVSEISAIAADLGARAGVVIAIHVVRVLVVVLVALPLLMSWLD